MRHYLQISILVALFAASVVKEYFSVKKKKKLLRRIYWSFMVIATIIGIINTFLDLRQESIKNIAIERYNEGQKFFFIGLDPTPPDIPALEQSIPLLLAAAENFKRLPKENFREASTRTAVAFAREKLSYAYSSEGYLYWMSAGKIYRSREARGDNLSRHPPTLEKNKIRCTDISNLKMWESAREQYEIVLKILLSSSEKKEIIGDLLSALRNAAYFFICDYLYNKEKSFYPEKKAFNNLLSAEDALKYIKRLCSPTEYNLPMRYDDAVAKIQFIDILKKNPEFIEIPADNSGKKVEKMRIITDLLSYNNNLERRDVNSINMIILHCTELPNLEEAKKYGESILYQKSKTGNSGHYYIDRDGKIYQYVEDDRIANHTKGYNKSSIGIEIVNTGRYPNWFHSTNQIPTEKYTPAQIESTLKILKYLKEKYPLISDLTRHSDLDKEEIPATDNPKIIIRRKVDPGPLFPWEEVLKKWKEMINK